MSALPSPQIQAAAMLPILFKRNPYFAKAAGCWQALPACSLSHGRFYSSFVPFIHSTNLEFTNFLYAFHMSFYQGKVTKEHPSNLCVDTIILEFSFLFFGGVWHACRLHQVMYSILVSVPSFQQRGARTNLHRPQFSIKDSQGDSDPFFLPHYGQYVLMWLFPLLTMLCSPVFFVLLHSHSPVAPRSTSKDLCFQHLH